MTGPVTIAEGAWGNPLPDWIEALARACEAESQNRVAAKLNRSASLISQVLRRKYPGDVGAVEDAVRGLLLDARVDCPELGSMPTNVCQQWRRQAGEFRNTNPTRVRMFKACRHCPRYTKGGQS